jgi:hypothetical protein
MAKNDRANCVLQYRLQFYMHVFFKSGIDRDFICICYKFIIDANTKHDYLH